jgi:hypothetical protein
MKGMQNESIHLVIARPAALPLSPLAIDTYPSNSHKICERLSGAAGAQNFGGRG